MLLLIIFFTFVFVFIAFIGENLPSTQSIPFFVFISMEADFVRRFFVFFIAGYVVLLFLLFRFPFQKEFLIIKNYGLYLLKTIIVCCSSIILSYLLLYVIGLAQVTVLTLQLNANPSFIGLETDRNRIAEALKSNTEPPYIIIHDSGQKKIAASLASAISSMDNFYGRYVLTSIPVELYLSVSRSLPGIMLIDNTLFVTKISFTDLQMFSSDIGYLFVKDYFPTRRIKLDPNFSIMDGKGYAAFRKNDMVTKLSKIDEQLRKITLATSSITDRLSREKSAVLIAEDKKALAKYKIYQKFYELQKERGQALTASIARELGVFIPPTSIKIVLDNKLAKAGRYRAEDYFAAIVHEYLHYASYKSVDKHFVSAFFEEGLTEYFARSAIHDRMKARTNFGYPAHVAIITEMMKPIPESEFADIYFRKDEEGLEKVLDRVYGEGFYRNNLMIFDTLHYSTNIKQVLRLTNDIMVKIGGEPLDELVLTGRSDS